MLVTTAPLTPHQARRVYDRIGSAQDSQAFYEDPGVARLVEHSALSSALAVFEIGCGTGRLAARLLEVMPSTSTYLGVDLSPVMVNLANTRLVSWEGRAKAVLVDGRLPLPAGDGSADRIVSTFVLDLFEESHARAVLAEAHRVLAPGGLVCLGALAPGTTLVEKAVSRAWMAVWRRAPWLVGGCRPIELAPLIDQGWEVQHSSSVHSWGLVVEVMVASKA